MSRILTILGVLLTIYSAKMIWVSVHIYTWNEDYHGFSKDPALFGNMPGLITIILGLVALILGIINRKITQIGAMVAGIGMLGWGLFQLYDKLKYLPGSAGFSHGTGLYIHAFAPLLVIAGAYLTLRKKK